MGIGTNANVSSSITTERSLNAKVDVCIAWVKKKKVRKSKECILKSKVVSPHENIIDAADEEEVLKTVIFCVDVMSQFNVFDDSMDISIELLIIL